MTKVITKSLFLCLVVVLLLPAYGISQSNPYSQYKDIIGSSYNSAFIKSAATPKVISNPEVGVFQVESDPFSGDFYRYTYQPQIDEGNTQAVIEYYKLDSQTGTLIPDFTTIYFRITKSIINCGEDRRTIDINSDISEIDVLENDTRSDGPLELTSILYSEGGVSSIVNGKVDFTPFEDFEGDAFVYYSVVDAIGKSGTGILKIRVLDLASVPLVADIKAVSYGGEDVELDLPFDGFQLESTLTYGSFENVLGYQTYSPYNNENGSESFVLRRGDLVRNVQIDIKEKPRNNSWVIDDVRYTAKGVPVTLDVTQNDHKQNKTILYTSPELVQQEASDGLFKYTPSNYFTGSKVMTYTVFDGWNTETGRVTVHVNNFTPSTQVDYDFTTVSNSALVIDYKVPISNYSFTVIDSPENGRVIVNQGSSTIDVGCEQISGTNLIIYEPSYNYQGDDEFKVRYCVDGSCKNISIAVSVIQNELEDCACYTGCVWAGDANNDGVVNASDLVSMAYAIGATGEVTDWNGGSGWIGRKTGDWLLSNTSGVNAKYADADGNGIVDELDFEAIENNYNENHALVPPQFLDNKNYPFSIQATSDTVYAGDLISFEIGIGNATYPALDVNGLVYSLGFPPNIVDSASLLVDYPSDSWLGVDEKVIGLTQQIRDGWIETAVARLGAKPKSGEGQISTLSFIVEEDVVGGFRVDSDGIIPIVVSISDAKVMGGDGQFYNVPGTETTVYININERSPEDEGQLIVYPNPASDLANIHMNGDQEILSYEVYNVSGQKVQHIYNVNSKSDRINLSNFHSGIYILKATTTSGVKVAKFEVY